MSDVVIRAEQLSKRYSIQHQQEAQQYVALRDVLAHRAKSLFRKPFSASRSPQTTEDFWALKDVSFEIKQGEVVGIIGRNGAGKSTLLKILSRITEPTTGRVSIKGRIASLLEVGTGFHPELTGRENIYLNGAILGMSRMEVNRKFEEIVSFAEIEKFLDTPVKRYSSGMYMRLAFAVAAHLEPEILVVDEVLAVGDAEFQKKCIGKMDKVAREGRTVLFVSHNLASIEKLCTRGVLLNKGKLITTGTVKEACKTYIMDGLSNEIEFNGIVKKLLVRQVERKIEIIASYQMEHPIHLPCLGFVISDFWGNPICGSNPIVDDVSPLPSSSKSGEIKVELTQPTLLNGLYRLSIWFGDGKEDYFIKKDCLTFDVVNMGNLKQLPVSSVGPVQPVCKWQFD